MRCLEWGRLQCCWGAALACALRATWPGSLAFWSVALSSTTKRLWGTKSCRRWDLQTAIDFHVIIWYYLQRACAGDGWGIGPQWPHSRRNTKRFWQWWQIPAVLWPLIIRHSATGVNNMNLSVSWALLAVSKNTQRAFSQSVSSVSLCISMGYDNCVWNMSARSNGNSIQRLCSG